MSSPPNIIRSPRLTDTLAAMQQQSQKQLQAGLPQRQITSFIALAENPVYADPSVNQTVSTSGLVGYWPFEEGSGTTTEDYSGNGNEGTLVNSPSWIAGKFGGGLEFNGSDSEVTVSATLGGGSNFSVSYWIYPFTTSGFQWLLNDGSSGCSGSGSYGWRTFIDTSNFHVETGAPPSGGCASTAVPFTFTNTWVFVVVTFDGSNMRLYFNGIYEGTLNFASGFPTTNALRFGSTASSFNGIGDEARVYSRVLSDGGVSVGQAAAAGSDVYNLYNGTIRTVPNDQSVNTINTGCTNWRLDAAGGGKCAFYLDAGGNSGAVLDL